MGLEAMLESAEDFRARCIAGGLSQDEAQKAGNECTGEYIRRCCSLAVKVLEASRNQLFFRYRFLEQALFRLEWARQPGILEEKFSGEKFSLGSEGVHFFYDERYILKRYTDSPEQMSLDYLHTVMHCLYQHPFFCPLDCLAEERKCWDLAADMAVECVLDEMYAFGVDFAENGAGMRRDILRKIKREAGAMSAQKIYAYLQAHIAEDGTLFGLGLHEICGMFKRDEHFMWYKTDTNLVNGEAPEENLSESGEASKESRTEDGLAPEESPTKGEAGYPQAALSREELRQLWKNAASQILIEAQAHTGSGRGEIAGSMLQTLKNLTRETYDYTTFLTKFAANTEERMQTDEDEFDYIFYTYGLNLFGKVPLIEPLEYKEKNLIREFVIAIDTSGSCQGETVENFLKKTYNILRQADSFTSRMHIHIVQCDAHVQEDTKIESREELEEYIAHLTLKGFGGTDFRPVFAYADNLLETGEVTKLDGLLYFTDGHGSFPAKPPGYKTAFVIPDKEEDVKVPPWAMKVYLDAETFHGKINRKPQTGTETKQ